MTMRSSAGSLVVAVLLGGCPPAPSPSPAPPSRPPAHEPSIAAPTSPIAKPTADHPVRPDGEACNSGAECASGTCEGLGCDGQRLGTCAPAQRGCTRDRRPYCGCDNQTFQASGSCPGRRFSARTACP